SILDQIASFASGEITVNDVQYVLGYLPQELLNSFMTDCAGRQLHNLMNTINRITEDGYDLHQFVGDVRDYFRKLLIVASDNEPTEEPQEQMGYLRNLAKKFTVPELIRDMRLMSRCMDAMRWSDQPRLLLELYTARVCEPYCDLRELAARIESSSDRIHSEPVSTERSADKQQPSVKKNDTNCTKPTSDALMPDQWHEIIGEIGKTRPSLSECLKEGVCPSYTGNQITLECSSQYAESLIKKHAVYVERIVSSFCDRPIRLSLVLKKNTTPTPGKAPSHQQVAEPVRADYANGALSQTIEQKQHPEDDPSVQKILNVFPGKIIF
ncbi:MAG: hypothetical protein GF384_02220, partial [Elusimicrobia bacterium]|nr:hypothetical protein [Elusimicrobiota bacterium]MBD3411793.1 hypothetical protein [Elusimicrobiota bacterium]